MLSAPCQALETHCCVACIPRIVKDKGNIVNYTKMYKESVMGVTSDSLTFQSLRKKKEKALFKRGRVLSIPTSVLSISSS